jgi:hypothetical protein
MTSKELYAEKLKDPKWKAKREEILERDGHECVYCREDHEKYPDYEIVKGVLDVHHRFYRQGSEPWEYPQEALITLCRECHENEEYQIKQGVKSLTQELRRKGRGYDFQLLSVLIRSLPDGKDCKEALRLLINIMLVDDLHESVVEIFKAMENGQD